MSFKTTISTSVTIIFLIAPFSASAQSSLPPPPVDIPVPLVKQDTPEWCWLAVAEMIMRQRMGFSQHQCELMEVWDNFPEGTCCSDVHHCSRHGIDLIEVAMVLERFVHIRTRYTTTIPPFALYSLLQTDRPVIAQIRERNGSTHAVVIRGMHFVRDYSQDDGWQAVLLINDPMSSRPHTELYNVFVIGWLDSLVIEHP
jgi:hypothetical protein